MQEKNDMTNKGKKGKKMLALFLAFLLVSGTWNPSGVWNVYAQKDTVPLDETQTQSEAVTEQSSENGPETESEDGVLTEDETESIEDTTETVTENTGTLQTEESLIVEESNLFATQKSAVSTIMDWQWTGEIDALEIQQDEETGVWGLGLPGVTIDNQADFDTVVSMLPASITATVIDTLSTEDVSGNDTDSSHEKDIPITWNCDAYVQDENRNWPVSGNYTFTVKLPEGYAIAENAKKLEVTVQLGEAEGYLTPADDGYYQISTADELIDFATLVNKGSTNSNAKLTNDIDMSGKAWTPIGTEEVRYAGTFDGQGFCIKNISISSTTDGKMGIFRYTTWPSTIKNLGVTGSMSGFWYVAGICYFNGGLIENCWNGASITVSFISGAGIAVWNDGTIRNCYNIGTIETPNGNDYGSGGIIGLLYTGASVTNCFNYGKVSGNAGAIGGESNESVKNCYYLSDSAPRGTGGTSKTEEEFKSGEVAWLLNGKKSEGVWKQTLGTGTAGYPSFSGDIVYYNDGTYSNTPKPPSTPTATVTSNSITITSQTASSGTTTQYACKAGTDIPTDSDWKTTNEFTGLNPATKYTCYVRFAASDSYLASDSVSQVFYTAAATPNANAATISYTNETIQFADTYEVNTSDNFDGTTITREDSITDYISAANGTEQKLYIRVKAVENGAPASAATEITIPVRPQTPNAQVTKTASTISLTNNTAWEYSIDNSTWNGTYQFSNLGANQSKTYYVRAKATATSFKSAVQTVSATTNAASYHITIPMMATAGGDAVNVTVNSTESFDLGYNGQVHVKANYGDDHNINNAGILTLTRESATDTITSQMYQGDTAFMNLAQDLAVFTNSSKNGVAVKFGTPSYNGGTIIPAGDYSGTVTFQITYDEQQ